MSPNEVQDTKIKSKITHSVLNWTEVHRSNESAVLAGEDHYDAALRYSRDWKPPQKESSKADLLMKRMGETLDRIPEWIGRRRGTAKAR